MSGKKRITVDQAAWREAMNASRKLHGIQRDLPQMVEAVKRAQETQAASDRAAMRARQDELTRQLAGLSQQARDRLDSALSAERTQRERETAALREEILADRAGRARVLETAAAAVADARVLHDAIASALPHERFAPGQLARLTSRLGLAESSAASAVGETALAQVQELQLSLGELRAEVELADAEWRAAHLTALARVTALAEEISYHSMIKITDDEAGVSADLDVNYWSGGGLDKIKATADEAAARVRDETAPPSAAELEEISERTIPALESQLSDVVAAARTRQWAAQVRVNMAEMVVETLESTTGYRWDGDAAFAGDDQREACYAKLASPDDSEIVIEVAPDETGESCAIRVLSYEAGEADESQRTARVNAIADALRKEGLSGTPAAEEGEPDPRFKDFERIRRGQSPHSVPERD